MKRLVSILGLTVLLTGISTAGPLLDKAKEVGGTAVEMVGETATSVGKAVKGDKEDPAMARAKIDEMASAAVDRLVKEAPAAAKQLEESAGYAVFDSRRMSLLIAAGYGQGVAVDRGNGKRVYMKMATAGANLGFGAQDYQLVFLFPASTSFDNFVTKGWDVGADADAVAGEDAEGMALRLPDGTRVYKMTQKGVMLSVALTGTRYWQSEELNAGRPTNQRNDGERTQEGKGKPDREPPAASAPKSK